MLEKNGERVMSIPLHQLGAREAVRLLSRRELTAGQLVRACLARIEQRESSVHAWQVLDRNAVVAQADALDRGPITGPLHGLPVGVMDVFDTFDLPTSYGSSIYTAHRPAADAAAVAISRQAGALVMGKTATMEFAAFQAGPTRNPRNPAYTPGGACSGSAAAVADNMVPLALGIQAAGAIIRPAAYCGVVGFKPSYGSIPNAGAKTLAEGFDTPGAFARSVGDVALFASVLMRDTRLADLPALAKPRIGMYRTWQWQHAGAETKAAFAAAAATLSRAGANVSDVPLPRDHCPLAQIQADIMAFTASRSLAYERSRHAQQISPTLSAMLESGERITLPEHQNNLRRADEARMRVQDWFGDYDVLLTPSTKGEAPIFEQGTGDSLFCRGWSLFGVPCVHLPFTTGSQGLPVGLQMVGPRDRDFETLGIAQWAHEILLAGAR
jgi:Asp-tRNA(Asn)/Glu-tRNA(Gln) amidotransferase A subunit family amidase